MRRIALALVLAPALGRSAPARAQSASDSASPAIATPSASPADTTIHVAFGGFVDSYFAYDFNHPRDLDRPFTTQAARHDEFNINLAFIEAALTGPRVHGRFAAQFGTAVQANYAGEPRIGSLSGPDVSRFIQEAYAGYQLVRGANGARPVWLDAGVFFSPFGSENWISRDNWTYTRSLIADNSPYYESGVRLTWQVRPTLEAQVHLINGWQNISETNSDKSLGLRLDYTPRAGVDIAYDGYFGDEAPDSAPSQPREWNELIVQLKPLPRLGLRGTFDYGWQRRADGNGSAYWRGWAAVAQWRFSPLVAGAGRVEGYSDPEQVIVVTRQPFGLRATGGSFNIDVTPAPRVLWRVELRGLHDPDPLFTHGGGIVSPSSNHDVVLVPSAALTF